MNGQDENGSIGDPVNLQPDVEIIDPKTNSRTILASTAQASAAETNARSAVNRTPRRDEPDDDSLDEMEEEIVLKYGATHLMKILVPVTLCMVFVILSLTLITSYQSGNGQTL